MSTPAFAPQNMRLPSSNDEDGLKTTANVLDSLVAYYQHEKMWVYRTRASLEDAFSSPPLDGAHLHHHQQQPVPYYPERSRFGPANPAPFQSLDSGSSAEDGSMSPSRWKDRKKGFKLRLEGIRSRRVVNTQPSDQLQPQEQILEMYERMMEARLQSCQRVSKLIQDANRAKLHHR